MISLIDEISAPLSMIADEISELKTFQDLDPADAQEIKSICNASKAEMRRRWKQYLRPHVVRVSSTGELWCGANESQVREAVRTESVPKHRGFCAHCRAAYRRKSRG